MFTLYPSEKRGKTQIDWLDSYHSFSFGNYYDPGNMGFGPLRVINEDVVAPGSGFHTHGHKDMEIITYILQGELAHRDSLGHGATISAGEVQKMTAGTGIEHSEFNASKTDPVHLVQIWIKPNARNLPPSYGQIRLNPRDLHNQLLRIATNRHDDNILHINQDVNLSACVLDKGKSVEVPAATKRPHWLQCLRGAVQVGDVTVKAGDGLAIQEEDRFKITANDNSEFLLFDLPHSQAA